MVSFANWVKDPSYNDRMADTQRAIDEDPSIVRIERGRAGLRLGPFTVRIIASNNIPNRYVTAQSMSLNNDVNILAMPGTDIRARDRVFTEDGQSYVVTFVMPEQDWEVVAQASTEAQSARPA